MNNKHKDKKPASMAVQSLKEERKAVQKEVRKKCAEITRNTKKAREETRRKIKKAQEKKLRNTANPDQSNSPTGRQVFTSSKVPSKPTQTFIANAKPSAQNDKSADFPDNPW